MADYFENNWKSYRQPLDEGRLTQAVENGLALLDAYRTGGNKDYVTQHKGTPFYVLGYAAFASHDYTGASLFFDAAASEDIRAHGSGANTPALLFIHLDTQGQDVLASGIVRELQTATQELLDDYNKRASSNTLTFADFRKRFLAKIIASPDTHKRALVTAFISFIAEWKYRLRLLELIDSGSREVFFLHLFRGCVLFESLLKENPTKSPTKDTLRAVLEELHAELSITKGLKINSAGFDAALSNMVAGSDIEATIVTTGKFRNTLGHKLSWPHTQLDAGTYDSAVKAIASSCMHVISKLYL